METLSIFLDKSYPPMEDSLDDDRCMSSLVDDSSGDDDDEVMCVRRYVHAGLSRLRKVSAKAQHDDAIEPALTEDGSDDDAGDLPDLVDNSSSDDESHKTSFLPNGSRSSCADKKVTGSCVSQDMLFSTSPSVIREPTSLREANKSPQHTKLEEAQFTEKRNLVRHKRCSRNLLELESSAPSLAIR